MVDSASIPKSRNAKISFSLWNQQPVHSQANFVEVGFVPLKALKPKEIGIIWETNIGIEVKNRSDPPPQENLHE
jgi:hypothetical protein